MIRHPLQRGVAEDHVDRAGRAPVPEVLYRETDLGGGIRSSAFDHLRRGVDAEDGRARPPVRERGGELAGTAPEVNHQPGFVGADLADQVGKRSGALRGKLQIGRGIPHTPRFSCGLRDASVMRGRGDYHTGRPDER